MDKDKRNTLIVLGFVVIGVIMVLFLENGTRILLDKKYETLDGIVINSDLANIDVQYINAEDINVLVYGKKNDNISYYVEDEILFINKESSRGFCLVNCSDKIILYLPQTFPLLDITTNMGKVDTGKVIFDKIIIKTDIGNIDIGTVKEADITSDIGNVTIDKIEGEADSSIVTGAGKVTIKKTTNLNVEAETNTGKKDIKKTKDNEYTLSIKTDMGNIKVG